MSGDSGPTIPVDMELKQAFRELQEKMISTQQQLKISDMQIEQQKHQITYANLVEKEIANLAPDTKTYEGVGRMLAGENASQDEKDNGQKDGKVGWAEARRIAKTFVLQPLSTIEKNLKEKVKTCEEKIKSIEGNKVYLERSIKEGEENLRELVLSKKREQTQ